MTLLLGLIALVAAYLLPGHYEPWTSFEQEALAALAVGLISLTLFLKPREQRTQWPALARFGLLAALIPWLQWYAGQIVFFADTLLTSLYLAGFALSVVVGCALAKTRRVELLDGLCWAFIAAGTVSGVMAIMQWLGWKWGIVVTDMRPGGRPFGNLAQPNHLATLIALMIMSVIRLFEHRRFGATAALLLAFFAALVMSMTQSRTGWLFAALLVVWWFAMRSRVALRTRGPVLIAGVLAFAAVVALWTPLNDYLLLSSVSMQERLQGGTRSQHWQMLLKAAWEHPAFGYGWEQVGLAQQAVALDFPATHEWLNNSHDLLLDLMLWNGIPIGLAFFAGIVYWFARQVRACRTADQWTLLIGVGAIFLHALLEFPLDYTYFLLPLGLVMGALEAITPPTTKPVTSPDGGKPSATVPTMWLALPIAALMGMLVWIGAEYLTVRDAAVELRYALLGFDRGNQPMPPVPDVVLLDDLAQLHRFWITRPTSALSAGELEMMKSVAGRFATAGALVRYAQAAGLNARPDEASRALGLACKLHIDPLCVAAIAQWHDLQAQHAELRAIPAPTREPPPLAKPGQGPGAD